MADAFYPFVGEGTTHRGHTTDYADTSERSQPDERVLSEIVENPARIAVFDDAAAAPRVVVVQPTDVRSYLEEITATVTHLAKEQGGRISFTVIREVVENLVHAYFIEPTISILDEGNTIRFSDQGPGIQEKSKALEYGTTSATEEMKRYIRGVGSGLPYAQQYMRDHGGDLTIEDNISAGTIVTIHMSTQSQSTPAMDTSSAEMSTQPAQVTPGQGVTPDYGAAAFQAQQPQIQNQQQTWNGYPYKFVPQGQPYAYPPQQLPQTAQPLPQTGFNPYMQQQPAWQGQAQSPGIPPTAAPYYQQHNGYSQDAQTSNPPAPLTQEVTLNERGYTILAYLIQHDSVGPTELSKLYGNSLSTWTRELQRLEDQRLVQRNGQKRFITNLGRAAVSRH